MEEFRKAYRILSGRTKRKTLFGAPRHGWQNNSKIQYKGRMAVDSVGLG
jgi:hypothetical protein